jgi:hypothetical protein
MSLRGFQSFDESGLSEVLTDNLLYYLDYGFVEKGGYINIQRPSINAKLYHVKDPRESTGKLWASRRKNWVWENEVGIPISGVWVNNTLMTSGYTVSYRDGSVLFDTPISINSTVEVNHSYKYIHVFDADENRIFDGDKESFDVTDNLFINGSGYVLPDRRIQLPAIGLEVLTDRNSKPFELGNLSQNMKTRVLCNVLCTDNRITKRIGDYLSYQKDKVFVLFDRDQAASSGFYPINYDGSLNNSSGTYIYLSENFPYSKVFAKKVYVSDLRLEKLNKINGDLFHLTARMELECVF